MIPGTRMPGRSGAEFSPAARRVQLTASRARARFRRREIASAQASADIPQLPSRLAPGQVSG